MSFSFALNAIKYEDVRNQIVEFLKDNSEYSGQFDFTASNIGLIIDTMAYVTMMMSYQVSNTANNLFLDTTTIRKNALSIAKTMGYRPQRSMASKITGTIQYIDASNNLTNHTITIPAYSTFISDSGYQYITPYAITLSSVDSHTLKANVVLYEGMIKKFTYLGNGNKFQSFIIPSSKVDENNFRLTIRKNNEITSVEHTEIKQSFNLMSKNAYFVEEDLNSEGYVKVIFGDGDICNYPANNEIVEVYYLETNGPLANKSTLIQSLTLSNLTFSDSFPSYNISKFTNIGTTTSLSFGGTAIETLDIIKQRASKSFATVGRSVTQNDFKTLLYNYPYVTKANSIGGDILYPNNSSKLGNIYLSCVPILEYTGTTFYNSTSIYLTEINESNILNDLNKYRIISTKLNFLKPSYIILDISPTIEIKSFSSPLEIDTIKTTTISVLKSFTDSFNDFALPFRASKLNGALSTVDGVVSSEFTTKYSFALGKESFYQFNTDTNVIFLPVVIDGKDVYGNVTQYTNFVRTNIEQKELLKLTEHDIFPIEKRTIYGKISIPTGDRYIYNEDVVIDGIAENCNILIHSKNVFFDLYRFNNNQSNNLLSNQKTFTINGTPQPLSVVTYSLSGVPTYGDYDLTLGGVNFGKVKQTLNHDYGFKGLIVKESDITSTTHGDFYNVAKTTSISGSDKAFSTLYAGDTIIYNSSLSGAKWVKVTDKGTISAVNDYGLFNNIEAEVIYLIAPGTSGTFGGRTPQVSGGEHIIFNLDSLNTYNWDKINFRNTALYNFDATTPIVKAVEDYQMRKVIGLDLAQTTFGGRSRTFSNNNLIYYNPSASAEIDKWTLIGNTSISGSVNLLPIIYANAADPLGVLDYHPVSGIPIGKTYLVKNIGNFGGSTKVNWPSINDVAYDGDVLLYIGNQKFNIWQESLPNTFNIKGTVTSALPIKITYGDMFVVSVSGTFQSTNVSPTFYNVSDKIVYTGSNTWKKYVISNPVSELNPSSSDNLPKEATIGDVYLVNEDGSFGNSYMVSPANDAFVQGDYIIYNGTTYTKLNEYTFEYYSLDNDTTGKDYLNNTLNMNSVFHYEYDYLTQYYKFYFNDIYHGVQIGTFRYSGNVSTSLTLYDVGKLTFEKYIDGNYDLQTKTGNINVSEIFDDTTINSISFLPKNKVDINSAITTAEETNFETNFNIFLIVNTSTPTLQ